MIDFQLTSADRKILSSAHEQALIGRRYARYYDKHEDELEPEEFPEAANLPNPIELAEQGAGGISGPRILHSLVMLEIYWGGIALKAFHYSRFFLRTRRILNEVLNAPDRYTYTDLAIADRDARCWVGAVDVTVGMGNSYGLSLCLRLLALVDLLARASWAAALCRLERDGADLDPTLLRTAASIPLTPDARFDETGFRSKLAQFAFGFALEGQTAPRLTGPVP